METETFFLNNNQNRKITSLYKTCGVYYTIYICKSICNQVKKYYEYFIKVIIPKSKFQIMFTNQLTNYLVL